MKTVSHPSDEPPRSPHHFLFKVTPHLKNLAKKSPAVKKEFFPSSLEERAGNLGLTDPLNEDRYIKTKGLMHKYPGRVLIELTLNCAAYCRFCTRRRKVSDLQKGLLNQVEISAMIEYLRRHSEINEVVISGGDPLTAPRLLRSFLKECNRLPNIKVIRIHTRVPVSDPHLVTPDVLKTLKSISNRPLYLSVHFEHPDELTPATIKAINQIRKTGAILLSQSVFLKGINDSYKVLYALFTKLTELGIRPYYLYRCDPVEGIEHFHVPLVKEIKIMTKLRANLSGIACPLYAIDAPGGSGKIPVPLNFWQFDKTSLTDFKGKKIKVI